MRKYWFVIKELNSFMLYRETLVQQKEIKVLSLNCKRMYELKVSKWCVENQIQLKFGIIVYHQNGVLQQPITVEGTHGI